MSEKRGSAESSRDQPENVEDFGPSTQVGNAKRSKLSISGDTELQDLPIPLLERILARAITTEVKGLHLAKSVWKVKADLVIHRLQAVSSQWNNILTSSKFRNEVYSILDDTAEKAIRLEILHQQTIPFSVLKVVTMKAEMFMLCRPEGLDYHVINVYDRYNLDEVKDVIDLQGLRPGAMAACSVSNCLYLLHMGFVQRTWEGEVTTELRSVSVLCINRGERNRFFISGSIDLESAYSDVFVSATGDLIVLSKHQSPYSSIVTVFHVDGTRENEIRLDPGSHDFQHIFNVIQRSNGNLLLVAANEECETKLFEIDTNGTTVRQYQSTSLCGFSVGHIADTHGRVFITDWGNRMELLDSELNLLEFKGPRLIHKSSIFAYEMHYDNQRNQIVRIDETDNPNITNLTIFRFAEE